MKTVEEIYTDWFGSPSHTTRRSTSKANIIEAMKEYANEYAREALKNASKHFAAPWNKEIILSESNLPKH